MQGGTDKVKIRNDSSSRDNRNIMDVIYSRIARAGIFKKCMGARH
jgi:hypothetical protein